MGIVGCSNGREIGRSVAGCRRLFTQQSAGCWLLGKVRGREGERGGGRARTRCGAVRCGVWLWYGLRLLCCAVFCCVLCLLAGYLTCLRFLLSVPPPFPSSPPSSSALSCPALPTAPPSLEACHGQLHLCCGYFSLFALRTVVGRASRQPAQGSKPTPIQTPVQDAKGACATLPARRPPSTLPRPQPLNTLGYMYQVLAVPQS